MTTVLFVHQSADLYGSDRSLLMTARGLDPNRFKCVVVVPSDGPLVAKLREAGIETHVIKLAKLTRARANLVGLFQIIFSLLTSMREITDFYA